MEHKLPDDRLGAGWAGPDTIPPVPDDDAEARFARLEDEVAELREQVTLARSDASAARVLAGGADRDVSEVRAELRAHTQGLNALRETQLEQGQAIAELRQEMGGLRQEMRSGFATMATGMAQITALLTEISGPERDSN